MGIFAAGDILNAIFPPKLKQIYYDNLLKEQQDAATGQIGANRALNAADLGIFDKDAKAAAENVRGLTAEDQRLYGNMARILAGSDPLATRGAVGQQNFDLFDKYAKRVGSETSLSDKLQSARLGYGERGPSTYSSTLIADRTARNLSPALAALLGQTGADSSRVLADRRLDFGAADAAINSRANVPTRVLSIDMAPITARNQVTAQDLASIMAALNSAKANTAGFKEEKNKWAAAGQAIDSSLNEALSTALSLYSGGMMGGGGGGGGIMSMFGGGNKASGGGIGSAQMRQLQSETMGLGGPYSGGGGYLSNYAVQTPYIMPPTNYGGYGMGYGGGYLSGNPVRTPYPMPSTNYGGFGLIGG